MPQKAEVPLQTLLSGTSPELRELIEGMLIFNPEERWTISQCLQSKVFDKIRIKSLEAVGMMSTIDLKQDYDLLFSSEVLIKSDSGFSQSNKI